MEGEGAVILGDLHTDDKRDVSREQMMTTLNHIDILPLFMPLAPMTNQLCWARFTRGSSGHGGTDTTNIVVAN